MDIQSVTCIYFSPTGTTRAIVENIAMGMEAEKTEMIECTKRLQHEKQTFNRGIVIFGAPVYYGRIPEEAKSLFSAFTAQQIPVVVVVVYGNRAYDDALKELYDITVTQGFVPVAGGAFIGEHSYSSSEYPIAQGRPDSIDQQYAREFGMNIRKKLRNLESLKKINILTVPGNIPYVEPKGLFLLREERKNIPYTPETDISICTHCGKCAEFCPARAVSPENPNMTDRWKCIMCLACVKNCPTGARNMKNGSFEAKQKWLHDNCQSRREPELYL